MNLTRLSIVLLAAAPAALAAQGAAARPLPLKHRGGPTRPAISAADLMTRLYVFADDSMMGREAGTEGNIKGTEYIAREARRIGLRPAGENGGYFQDVPLVRRSYDLAGTISSGDQPLEMLVDVAPYPSRGTPRSVDGAQVVYGGAWGGDSSTWISAEQAAGKLVVLGFANPRGAVPSGRAISQSRFAGAAGLAFVGPEPMSPALGAFARQQQIAMRGGPGTPQAPLVLIVTPRGAERLLGTPAAQAAPGTAGRTVRGNIALVEVAAPARNVIAVLPGSDPRLAAQYVAIGAHNDHVGFRAAGPVDHDSLRAFNAALVALGATDPLSSGAITAEQRASIRVNLDSLRRLRPARPDSINNGADDDGSGSMAVLEMAEAFAALRGAARPKRSILFVWHTGEEKGLLGAHWYTDHPTVPRDSVVAQLNMDMVGRGGAADIKGGGPDYVQLVGSRRLSTQLGDLIETVGARQPRPFRFDYTFDATGHPEQIYCRSDHYEYARWGIPVTFFTTGQHGDYHQVTDEPQYIDYPHMQAVTKLVYDVATQLANAAARPAVDKPKPDPTGVCRQ